jgi:hypothetical protein
VQVAVFLPETHLSPSRNPNNPTLQGYLAQKTPPPRRTLQQPYGWGPTVVLGGWVFLMGEVPLYTPRMRDPGLGTYSGPRGERGAWGCL